MANSAPRDTTRGPWLGLFALATLAVIGSGYWYYRAETDRIQNEKYRELAVIAELKAGQIARWRDELLRDLQTSMKSPFLRQAVADWLHDPDNVELQARLRDRLDIERQTRGCTDAFLLDTEGAILLSAGTAPEPLTPAEKIAVEEALAKRTAVLSSLYRSPRGISQIDAVSPILDRSDRPMAVVALRTSADALLYPLIQSWPTPSRTAETLLVRRDGDNVLFLNDLRHKANTALSFRHPLSGVEIPAVQAVLGTRGIFRGMDYRGVEVVADLRPIPGSPWFMVAKVDASEILAEARYRGGVIFLLAAAFVVMAAGTTAYGYRLRQLNLFRALYSSERERRLAQDELRTTLYSIGDAVMTTGPDGLVKQMNPEAERLTGWTESEAAGRTVGDVFRIINEETRKTVENPVTRVIAEGAVVGLANHTLLVSREGMERPIADSGAPIKDDSGAVTGVVLVFRDQTEERAAQKALQESEARLRTYVESAPVGIYVTNPEGDCTFVNRFWCDMSGLSPAEAYGTGWLKALYHEDAETISDKWYRSVQTNGQWGYEYRFRGKKGDPVWVYGTAVAIRDGDGSLSGYLGTNVDITERKQAEELLRQSENKYRSLFEESLDGIFISTRDGELLDANQALLDMFGYSREDLRELRTLGAYADPGDQEAFRQAIESKGSAKDYYLKMNRKDGTPLECLVSATVRRAADGTVLGYRGMVRDITLQKALERQLQQAQKMEAIGTLAGGVAHDFNNLLQVINGYTEMALLDVKEDQSGYSELREIKHATKTAAELTQGLLAFSRRVESKLRPVDLNRELNRVAKMLARTLPKMIAITMDLAEPLHAVKADPGQVQQVIMNLAVNARDAMPEGGRLVIQTRNAYLDEEYCKSHLETRPGNYVVLSVSDTGPGMDEMTKQHIFDPFFTTKDTGKGTGLGLAIVFGVVKSHGGNIICYSEPGRGTIFKIYLPAIKKPMGEDHAEEVGPLPRGTETILLVDDDVAVRHLAEKVLRRFGYHVIAASNGREGVEVFARECSDIHLVILDLIMPEMSGRDCLAEIAKLAPRVKVIIASGYAANGQVEEALQEGAKGVLRKPYEAQQLLQLVRKVLDQA